MTEMQREALAVLAEVWELSPDVRLGQLMANLGFLGEVHVGKGLGYVEDDELIAVLYRHRAELRSRLEARRTKRRTRLAGQHRFPEVPHDPRRPTPLGLSSACK